MKLEEYEQILRTGTPSDRARAIAAASDDKEVSDENSHPHKFGKVRSEDVV